MDMDLCRCSSYLEAISLNHLECLKRLYVLTTIPFTNLEIKLCVEKDAEHCFHYIYEKMDIDVLNNRNLVMGIFEVLHVVDSQLNGSKNFFEHKIVCKVCQSALSILLTSRYLRNHFLSMDEGDLKYLMFKSIVPRAHVAIRKFNPDNSDFMSAFGISQVLKNNGFDLEEGEAEALEWCFGQAFNIRRLLK